MKRIILVRFLAIVLSLLLFIILSPYLHAQTTTIAQLSDMHLGLARAPEGADNLRKAVQMINKIHPDAVVVTGDIAERPSGWDEAKDILKGLNAKVYYIPGNHDVHNDMKSVEKYRQAFGDDYYRIKINNVVIYALDSQLMGNWDQFNAHEEPPMSPDVRQEGNKMLDWLASQQGDEDHGNGKGKGKAKGRKDRDDNTVYLAMQHVPAERDSGFPNDPKPYWTVNGEWRQREEQIFKKLGIHDVLAGHWHIGKVFNAGGVRWHVAPSTSWSPFGGKLGFAVHHISPDGDVKTEFVYLDGSTEKP